MSEQTTSLPGGQDPFAPPKGMNGTHYEGLVTKTDPEEIWEPSKLPLSVSVPGPRDLYHPAFGPAVDVWPYFDPKGALLFVVARFEGEVDGKKKKDVAPFCHGRRVWTDRKHRRQDRTGWHMKAPPAPRQIFNLHKLTERPDAPVLVVEGEKTAQAAELLFPDFVVVTSQGGSKAAARSDWTVLHRRKVVGWPDRDDPGRRYMNDVAAAARPPKGLSKAATFDIVQVPTDWPEGWDLADPLPPGVGEDLLQELLEGAMDADPPQLPPGFTMRAEGLFHYPESEEGERTFISAPFEVVGEANDGNGMNWGLLIRWLDRDTRRHQWSVPKRLVHADGNRIAEELEDAGLHCNPSGKARSLLKQFIGGVRSKRRLICVDRTGWHNPNGRSVFILPGGEAFGPAASTVILQTEHAGTDGAFIASGTLQEWQDQVARYASGNDRIVLAICTALATPLLDIVGGDSGGIHITGDSQTGKSTTLYAAGSVWGKGARGAQVRQWRATANGLEGAAAETSDTVLILDEMGQASGSDVADTIYMLANGSGKLRAGKEGGSRRSRTWRTMFLSTGEITLAAKMAEAGRKMMAGLEVRLVNLPADAGAGMGVFQKLHGMAGPAELAKHIATAAKTSYGTAGRRFLGHLVRARTADQKKLEARVKAAQAEFAKRYLPDNAAGQVRSVADRFALVGAAGELAIQWGVLPWAKGEASAAAAACFKTWLGERGGAGATEDHQALSQVQGFIEAHGESRFTPLVRQDADGYLEAPRADGQRTQNRVGWRRRPAGDSEGWEYLIMPTAWTNEVCKGLDPKRVAAVLRQASLLICGRGKDPSMTVKVPGEGTIRVYRVSGAILGMRETMGEDEAE
ncbi:DUF927 domain-containing protein [Roseomonas xinghualingensis]|uniref:DUF927 domain-containing protein n=1 Tax=Roseomonas xinghualingensis TaxID=2986475 RepID=UPI0021F1B752|nr:DUF927 domain-containing protein [Roseomonas sp. SXEYE001]MCV4206894.1 DUF927 domain-containing protein [Roseomonas sp. SXEYE001]